MNELIKEFNNFFVGDAEIVIRDNELEITIGARTMLLSLPQVIGTQSKGL